MVYAILFPQLFCVIYVPAANTYGALVGYITAVILRVGGGEAVIHLEPFIEYPYYNPIDGQLFPFRTLAMCCSFMAIVLVSYLTKSLFVSKFLPNKCDIFKCFHEEIALEFEMKKDADTKASTTLV